MEKDVKKSIKEIYKTINELRKAVIMVENVRYKHTAKIYELLREYTDILEQHIGSKKTNKLRKEIKEIENTISAGLRGDIIGIPLWTSFTRKEKTIKK